MLVLKGGILYLQWLTLTLQLVCVNYFPPFLFDRDRTYALLKPLVKMKLLPQTNQVTVNSYFMQNTEILKCF